MVPSPKPSRAPPFVALLGSLGLHLSLAAAGLAARHAQQREIEMSVAMLGSSIEVEMPTERLSEPIAAPAVDASEASATEPPPAPATDASEPARAEPSPAIVVEKPPPVRVGPKATPATKPLPEASRPRARRARRRAVQKTPAAAPATPSVGTPSDEPTQTKAPGTFGQEGLVLNGVRRLGYAFTRAIPAAGPADAEWHELPVGHVGTIRIELSVDESHQLGEARPLRVQPDEPAPPAVLERLVERTLLLLRGGQFALSDSNQPGVERLAVDVVIRNEAPDEDGADLVVQKGFSGASPALPGRAYFRYGTGRAVEATVTILRGRP